MPLLDKAYANALLFSVGLLLGSTGESTSNAEAARGSASPPTGSTAQGPRPRTEHGTESKALAALRRSDLGTVGQTDDLAAELELINERLEALSDEPREKAWRGPSSLPGPSAVTPELWERLRMPAIPFEPNARVEKYVRFFTESAEGRKRFVAWLARSGRYRKIVLEALRNNGVPQDLIAVAFIESGLRPRAVSSAGATGLWQFMPRTARAYGLTVGLRYDERRSIWHATRAAARHLADLHEYFQSWELALAAYNYGYERLAALSERLAVKDFWSLSAVRGALPRETVLYVPKVLAVSVILNNLEHFDLANVPLDPPIVGSPLQVPGGTRLSLVARAAGTSLQTIRAMNPEFRRKTTPRGDRPVRVHIPSEGLARARVLLPRLLEEADRKDDVRMPASFDWGRDDPDREAMDRLLATVRNGGDRTQGARADAGAGAGAGAIAPFRRFNPGRSSSYFDAALEGRVKDEFGPAPAGSATYFRGDPLTPLHDAPAPRTKPWRSTASEVVASSGMRLVCESPEDEAETSSSDVADSAEPARSRRRAVRGRHAKHAGKRRMKPRQDRRMIFYLATADDTASGIAQRFRVDEGELRNVNRMSRSEKLVGGALVKIPVPRGDVEVSRERREAKAP